MLADPELDAIVIATPVVTHYELAKQALLAGKHVFVEKPQAQSSAEAEELSALAAGERSRAHARLPPALPPGGLEAEAADRRRRPRRRPLPLRQPSEPRPVPAGRERPLVARRTRPLDDPAPDRRGARRGLGTRRVVPPKRHRGRRLLLPPLPVRRRGAHALSWLDPHKIRKLTVVGRDKMAVFDDMEPERKLTVYDKGPVRGPPPSGRCARATSTSRSSRGTSRCGASAALPLARDGEGDPLRRPARGWPSSARSSCFRSRWTELPRDDSRGDRRRLSRHGDRRGLRDRRPRRRRQAAGAVAALNGRPARSCLRSSSARGRSSRRARSSSRGRGSASA